MSSSRGVLTSSEPQQHCSPPPKPPRRRHSEQLIKSSGSSMDKQKVHYNGSLSLTSKHQAETEFASGSESLPADWISAHNRNLGEETISAKSAEYLLTVLPQMIVDSLLSNSSQCNNCFENSSENLESQNGSNSACEPFVNMSSPPITFFKSVTSQDVPSVQKECKSTLLEENLLSERVDEISNLNSSPKVYHRRHHSDPILPKRKHFETVSISKSKDGVMDLDFMHKPLTALNSSLEHDLSVYEELKILKETNDKLWQHLCTVQDKLDRYHNQASSRCEEDNSTSFSELISDVYNAQKERDCAIEKRLQTVIEQRDLIFKTLEEVMSIISNVEDYDICSAVSEDQEFKKFHQLFESRLQHPVNLLQQLPSLVTFLNRAKKNNLVHLSEELNVCRKEKEKIIEKVEKLEEDLMKWKISRCLLHSDVRLWETNMLDALCELITERDAALEKLKNNEEQLQLLQVHHSRCDLATHLPSEENKSLQKLNSCNKGFQDGSPDNFESSTDELKFLKSKLNNLTESLNSEMKRRQIAEENCYKLERLVLLLRKRINGANAGIPV